MKKRSNRPAARRKPSEGDIREYAFHLYQQSGCVAGHELENWFEATACLKADIPSHRSGARLHHYMNAPASYEAHALGDEAGRRSHLDLAAKMASGAIKSIKSKKK